MRLRSLAFAGYRSFAARSPAAPDRPLERIDVAPLTILIGKNNSGKSTAARLLHHVLLALGHAGDDPFPMSGEGRSYGHDFRDVQHGGAFFNPLNVDVHLASDEGAETRLSAQLVRPGDSADNPTPIVQSLRFGETSFPRLAREHICGLLPKVPSADPWRVAARSLLAASCHLGPIREPISATYELARGHGTRCLPDTSDAVAKLLLNDVRLRAAVGDWMAEHLEQWRVEVKQNLDIFSLVARRSGRESNLAASGQGIQQILPVVTLCMWRKLGRGNQSFLDIIEQPELHLHDAAHASLGDLLLSAIGTGIGNVVVETHSESLVLRVRRRIAEGLSPRTVALVYVEDLGEGSRLRQIPIGSNGEAEWWPEGIFSEAFVEVKAIRRAQRGREGA